MAKNMTNIFIIAGLVSSLTYAAGTATPPSPAKENINKETSYYDLKELSSPFVSWGVTPNNSASINLPLAWQKFKKKKDIIVAVVDTGIDYNHPFLEKNIYVPSGKVSEKNYGIDFSKNVIDKNTPIDKHGHGTHVSGIIRSIFPEVKILALKYFNPSASGDDNLASTVLALRYAVDHNVDIINYSGGGPGPAMEELRALKEAEKKGILVVVAAGNEESNIDDKSKAYFPASYGLSNVITVSAHDEDLKILPSSNYGKQGVDIFAPGYRIRSSLNNGRIGYLTGTSQATAFVTGVAALMKSLDPSLSTQQIKEIIKASAKKEVTLEGKCATGGRLNAGEAIMLTAKRRGNDSVNTRQVAQDLKLTKKKTGKIIYRLAN